MPMAVRRQASSSGEEVLTDGPEAAGELRRPVWSELSRPGTGWRMRMGRKERLPPSEGVWQGAQSPQGFAELCPPGPAPG